MNNHLAGRVELASTSEGRAAAIVKRLEEVWGLEQEESGEGALLFRGLCELLGEPNAFDRVAHVAS